MKLTVNNHPVSVTSAAVNRAEVSNWIRNLENKLREEDAQRKRAEEILRPRALSTIAAAAQMLKAYPNESAKLCLSDAKAFMARQDYETAHNRAVHSLAHSVGVDSAIYAKHSQK